MLAKLNILIKVTGGKYYGKHRSQISKSNGTIYKIRCKVVLMFGIKNVLVDTSLLNLLQQFWKHIDLA